MGSPSDRESLDDMLDRLDEAGDASEGSAPKQRSRRPAPAADSGGRGGGGRGSEAPRRSGGGNSGNEGGGRSRIMTGLVVVAVIIGLVGAWHFHLFDKIGAGQAQTQQQAQAPKKAAAPVNCKAANTKAVKAAVQKVAQESLIDADLAPSAAIVVGCGSRTVADLAVGTVNGKVPSVGETRYDQAGVTRLLVDVAINRLVVTKKLKTSDPVGKYLPAWKQGKKSKVTVAMLMNHTSGMLGSGETPKSLLAEERAGIGSLKNFEAIERQIINMDLAHNPGEFHESNLGYVVLYHVGGVAAGVPENFNRYMGSAVLNPLGMGNTKYLPGKDRQCAPTHPYEKPSATITCHARDLLARSTGEVGGNAGVFSTANDMAQLAMMLVNGGVDGGTRYVDKAGFKSMRTPLAKDNSYGAAVRTNSQGEFGDQVTSTAFAGYGDTGCAVTVDPASHMWIVVMSNASPTTSEKQQAVQEAVAQINNAAMKAARGKS